MIYRSSLKSSKMWRLLLTVPVNTCATVASLLINIILMLTTHISIGYTSASSSYAPLLFLLQLVQFFLGTVYCVSTLYSEVRKAMLVKFN